MAVRDAAQRLREALARRSVEAACRAVDPLDPAIAGILYDAPPARPDATLSTRLAHAPWRMVGYHPLGSSAHTPFELDGVRYASVFAFHLTLKLREDDPRRATLAAAPASWRTRVKPATRGSFRYRGEEVAVNSVEHGVLMARATEAKVLAHAPVRASLVESERVWLVIQSEGALGRYMPFALMVMRALLTRR